MKKLHIILLFLVIFIVCSQNICAGDNIFYSQIKDAVSLAQKQNKDFFPGSFTGRINQNKELVRCQMFFYRPVGEIPGSYEVFVYNYKDGKVTTGLRKKKDNNVFYSLDFNFINNLALDKIPNLRDPNTSFSFQLFGGIPYLYFSEKLESDGKKETCKTYLDDKYQIIPYNPKDDYQEYKAFINQTMLSLGLPDAQEAFDKEKEAIGPWIKNSASASLLNISGDISGLYPEQILKGRADLWRVTLSVGQNVYKVEIRNGVPQYIDALSSSSDQAVLVPDSKEIIQRFEKDGGTEWRDGLTGDEWYVYYSYPENGKFNISYRLNELRLDKKSFSKLY